MRIDNLEIRCFGRKSNLHLQDLSQRINVVYGPNGTGKSTTIQFIRWMLFGTDDDLGRRYLHDTMGRAEGRISFTHEGLQRSIARQDDGSRYGLVSFDDGERFAHQSNQLVSMLGDISVHDFDQLFAPNFEHDLDVYGLLRNAQARGLALTGNRVSNPRVPEIRMCIDNLRRDMDRLPWRASDLNSLVEQKRMLESRIAMLEDEYRRRRLDYDREYQEINRSAEELEQEIARVRELWHAKDDEVSTRRRELETAWRAAEEAKQEFLRRRREELASIEANIGRARAMINEVRSRYDRVDVQVREQHVDESAGEPEGATVCLVKSIAQQLDQLRQTPQTTYDATTGRYRQVTRLDPSTDVRSTGDAHSNIAPTLDGLRDEVGRLCRTLQERQTNQHSKQLINELDQLERCDHTMATWIDSLNQQREQVAAELEKAQRYGVSLVADTATGDVFAHHGTIVGEIARPDRIKAVPHACDSYAPIEPESDVLLRRLTAERDVHSRELEAAERRLRQLLDRRRELETAIGRLADQELEATRRELTELESLIRAAEERERIQREIERLEAELRRLQDGFQQSTIIQRANETLRRLSVNRLIAITVDGAGGVAVEDEAGCVLPFGQLGRGSRDHVYLSLMLALISAYRARSVELPLVLNDMFSHIDSQRDDATAAVLNDFAAQGYQILLLTRHRHVVHLFEPHRARFFELQTVEPVHPIVPAQDVVEAVRFRPRDEDSETLRSVRTARQVNRAKFAGHAPPRSLFAASNEQPTRSGSYGSEDPSSHATRPARHQNLPRDYHNVTLVNEESQEYAVPVRSHIRTAHPGSKVVASPSFTSHSVSPRRPGDRKESVVGSPFSRSTILADTGMVDADVISRLRAMSIVTVDDFLNTSPADIDRELHSWGLSTRPLRRWQDELLLRCHISGLSANEARLLVAAGVADLQTLADCEADTLAHQLSTLLSSRAGRGAPELRIDVAKAAQWVTAARRRVANYRTAGTSQWSARGSHPTTYSESESDSRRRRQRRSGERTRDDDSYDIADGDFDNDRRSVSSESELLGASSSSSDADNSRHRRAPRANRRTERTRRSSTSSKRKTNGRAGQSSRTSRGGELKYLLDRSASVVEAPSIGPRTAERLHKIGIGTVADLLAIDPETAAARINYRRITVETIRQWQAQAVLCCCIPMLRGHDARILVAVGVSNPDQLASMAVGQLWTLVQPFTQTTECKRIVRNGRMPDTDEIKDWIDWAKNARELSAA